MVTYINDDNLFSNYNHIKKIEITNIHILEVFERIKKELREDKFIIKGIPLTDDEQMFAHLISVYEATKSLIN
jgi:hypothetical protein